MRQVTVHLVYKNVGMMVNVTEVNMDAALMCRLETGVWILCDGC